MGVAVPFCNIIMRCFSLLSYTKLVINTCTNIAISDSNILGHALTGNRKEVANGYRKAPVNVTMTIIC